MAKKAGDTISCLLCHGNGYTVQGSAIGYPRPVLCRACGGTGVQEIKRGGRGESGRLQTRRPATVLPDVVQPQEHPVGQPLQGEVSRVEIKKRFTGVVLFTSEKASVRETVIEAVAGDADLRGADLRGADLRDAYLRGADLRGADLRDADLRDADPRGADLSDADLRGADLRGADLRDADLRGADLSGAKITITQKGTLIEALRVVVAEDAETA